MLTYDWSGEQAYPCCSTTHSMHIVLTSVRVMRGNVMRVKARPCCSAMHSTHPVLMSVHAQWGEVQSNCIVLVGGTVTLLSPYYPLSFGIV